MSHVLRKSHSLHRWSLTGWGRRGRLGHPGAQDAGGEGPELPERARGDIAWAMEGGGGGQQVGTRHSDQRLGWSFSGGEEPLAYEVGVHRGASWLRHYKLAGLL